MIFVTLGTQDKEFTRLLETVEKMIKEGKIKEKVIVQAGSTKWSSDVMEVYGMLDPTQFEAYLKQCDIVLTHGGVGTILNAMKLNKKIIAIPRLKKYGEHENDHQLQIVSKFVEEGYLLTCEDLNELDKTLEKVKTTKLKSYHGNNKEMLSLIESFIEQSGENQKWEPCLFFAFGILFLFLKLFLFYITYSKMGLYTANAFSWSLTYLGFIIVSYLYIFRKPITFKNALLTIVFGLFIYFIDTCFLLHFSVAFRYTFSMTIILFICQYIWSKAWIFRR